jgi:hypothetical protein
VLTVNIHRVATLVAIMVLAPVSLATDAARLTEESDIREASFDTSLSTTHQASRKEPPFTAYQSERIPTHRTTSLSDSLTTNLQSAKYPSAMLAHLAESSINLRTNSA